LARGGEKMRKNGGSNSAGMFDQYRDACATKDGQCWLEADYECTVSVMLCSQRICSAGIGVDKSRML
jgi:hypothetical protein